MKCCSNIFSVKIMLLEKTYHANMKVAAPFLLQQYRERNSITMEVETPERRKWMIQVGIQGQGDNSASADLSFRSVNNNNYHLTSDFRWQRLDGPFCFEAEAGIRYVSPQNSHAQFKLHTKHHSSPERRIIQLTVRAFSWAPRSPYPFSLNHLAKRYFDAFGSYLRIGRS